MTKGRGSRRDARLAGLSHRERLDSLIRVSNYVAVWNHALHLQADRIQEADLFRASADTWLWAAALGGLLRCVELAGDLGADVTAARDQFDRAVPNGKDVRDVIEHLEDYELGVGKQQRPGQGRLEFMHERGIHVEGDVWRAEHTIHLQGVGSELNYRTAQEAASKMAIAVMDAIDEEKTRVIAAGATLAPLPPRPDLEAVRQQMQRPRPSED